MRPTLRARMEPCRSPPTPSRPPSDVRALAGATRSMPVWRNDYGGLTFRTGRRRYIKFGARATPSPRSRTRRRASSGPAGTRASRTCSRPAPTTTHEWMVTRALPGESAVAPRWVAEPAIAVRAVGEGLRALHDALPVADCPFDWSVPSRIANAARRGIQRARCPARAAADRPARRLPRGCLLPEHPDRRRRPLDRPRRPRPARHRRPLGATSPWRR